jgi:FkbM family methyltransferase
MLDFSRRLDTPSFARYALWRLGGRGSDTVDLKFRDGTRIRHCAADYGNAYEIFVSEVYKPVRQFAVSDVRLIVDLGANVGFSALYFLNKFKNARIIAFEPHPSHIERARANWALNGATDKVRLYPAAASNKAGRLFLSDLGMSSTLHGAAPTSKKIEVDVMDVFEVLHGQPIDILKIDIEGAEYDIIADDRFLNLDIKEIAMEWHRNETLGDEHAWLVDRLGRAGYEIEDVFAQPHLGMLWAFRKKNTFKVTG